MGQKLRRPGYDLLRSPEGRKEHPKNR